MNTVAVRNKNLIFPELCYRTLGALFQVWAKIGPGHKESFYKKVIEEELRVAKIPFRAQLPVKIAYHGKLIGKYFFDFLIENKLALEMRVRNYFFKASRFVIS